MEEAIPVTPKNTRDAAGPDADTVILPKVMQRSRTLQDIINDLNDSRFLSLRRYRLKKEFLARLRNRKITGNTTLLVDTVLVALLKYVSVDDRQDILAMVRTRDESALQFAISRRYDLKIIKFLVEDCKTPVDPSWVSSAENDDVKKYLQEHTALYVAVQKKDLEGFKIALKKGDVKLTEYVGLSIVDVLQSKIRENQDRNFVVRYFLNRKWNRMLRATTGQIKKKLLEQSRHRQPFLLELLSLLNQCPPEEIYRALRWESSGYGQLYDKFKRLDLRQYLNIYLQRDQITSEEAAFRSPERSRVPSNLKIARQVPVSVPATATVTISQGKSVEIVPQEPDVRTRFHGYLRENDRPEIMAMIRQQSLSKENVDEVLESWGDIDDDIKNDLSEYLEQFEKPSDHPVRRTLSFTQ